AYLGYIYTGYIAAPPEVNARPAVNRCPIGHHTRRHQMEVRMVTTARADLRPQSAVVLLRVCSSVPTLSLVAGTGQGQALPMACGPGAVGLDRMLEHLIVIGGGPLSELAGSRSMPFLPGSSGSRVIETA